MILRNDSRLPPEARPSDRQEGGDHPLTMGLPTWDALKAWLTPEQRTGYLLGETMDYLASFNTHAPGKGGLPDLLKARHYLDKLIDEESRE